MHDTKFRRRKGRPACKGHTCALVPSFCSETTTIPILVYPLKGYPVNAYIVFLVGFMLL